MPRYLCDLTVRVVFGHLQAHSAAYLLAAFNSIIFDYLIRQKINGLHLSDYIVKQVPIPIPEKFGKDDLSFVVPRVLEMTYVARDVRSFAYDLEYHGPPFVWQEDRRAWLRAELDAYFARLYGLTREELLYILDPAFVKRADYPSETFRVLRNIDETKYGEYRTARLVMQAWDGLAVKGNVA